MKNQIFLKRFTNALAGVRDSWRSEKSFRFHTTASLAMILLLGLMRPDMIWMALLLMACGLVLTLELVNTAIEKMLDHMHPKTHPVIKTVKDTLAGAVLVASVVSVGIFAVFIGSLMGL